MKISSLRRERAIGGRRRVEYTRREGYTQGSLYRLTNSPRSFEDEARESEIRERDEAAKQKGRACVCACVGGQKTIGATRAETKATRGDTQYGDASGSLTAHNARSRVNFCAPVCLLPFLPSPITTPRILLRTRSSLSLSLSATISLFLYPKVRDSPYITRGDDTFNCTSARSRESNKFARFQSDSRIPIEPTRPLCFHVYAIVVSLFFFPPFSSSLFFFFFFCSSRFTDDKSKREIWQ